MSYIGCVDTFIILLEKALFFMKKERYRYFVEEEYTIV